MKKAPTFHQPTRFERRTLLKGLGAGAALIPLLESDLARAQANAEPKRLVLCTWPNGVNTEHFWPTGTETNFQLNTAADSPVLPLVPHKEDLLFLGGLVYQNLFDEPTGAGHAAMPFMYTGVDGGAINEHISDKLYKSAGGPSVDNFIAKEIAKTTSLAEPFLNFRALPESKQKPDSWSSFQGPPIAGEPNPAPTIYDARPLFDRLFAGRGDGDSVDPEVERIRQEKRSILDYLGSRLNRVLGTVGKADKERIQAHLDSVRSVERQLTDVTVPSTCTDIPLERPSNGWQRDIGKDGSPNFPDILKAHIDMTVVAMACDLTRVSNHLWANSNNDDVAFFWLGDEYLDNNNGSSVGGGTYLQHHGIAHARYKSADHTRRKNMVDQWFIKQYAYFIDRLKGVTQADGSSLFDHTVMVMANTQRDGHGVRDVPWMIAGGKWHFQTNRMVRWISGQPEQLLPQNYVLTSLCHAMGFPVQNFGDPKYGTGELSRITG